MHNFMPSGAAILRATDILGAVAAMFMPGKGSAPESQT